MLFWITVVCATIFSLSLLLSWFFDTETIHNVLDNFPIPYVLFILGHLYLAPAMICEFLVGGASLGDMKTVYVCFIFGIAVLFGLTGLIHYRTKYIMVNKP